LLIFCVDKTRRKFGYSKKRNQGEVWMDIWLFFDNYCSSKTVARVITSKNDQFIDPVREVPLDVFQWLKKKLFLFLPTNPIFAILEKHKIKLTWPNAYLIQLKFS